MLHDIITNQVLIIPLCSWAIAQMLKVTIILIRKKQLDMRYLVGSGGMPSSHSAFVSALATSVGLIEGWGSTAFGISAIFTLVVIYDAAGVRRSVGQQSAVLNRIIKELVSRRPMLVLGRDLREFVGHTQLQVIIGVLIGIFIAWSWVVITGG
ncbi:divergent PAP2 family protein [Chloroflexota bacterium]